MRRGMDRTHGRRMIYMHREILQCHGEEEGDHWNHRTLDNRRSNLRKCSHAQNASNVSRPRDNRSGFKGVVFEKRTGKWYAQIRVNRKQHHLGTFTDKEDAARAYDAAARQHFGEFALTNFP
jgi:hypothetical protein